jgi:hypothetical protein
MDEVKPTTAFPRTPKSRFEKDRSAAKPLRTHESCIPETAKDFMRDNNHSHLFLFQLVFQIMPVPKRRQGSRSLTKLPSLALRCLNIDSVFQKSRTLLLWGFAPTVVIIGMMTEPRPGSWLDIINILE